MADRTGPGTRWAALIAVLMLVAVSCSDREPRRGDRNRSAGLAPRPEEESAAVVQVYAARTYGWRGIFAVHAWIAFKERGAEQYEVYDVVAWGRRDSVVRKRIDIPDRPWYGAEPEVLQTLRGKPAERAIPKIRRAIESYPYPETYLAYPGPNSNTFVSHVLRNVSELSVELPPIAIGKDWIEGGGVFAKSESGTGFQISVLGLLAITLGLAEGIEINIIGLTIGIDLLNPAIKLPIIGRIGCPDRPLPWHP